MVDKLTPTHNFAIDLAILTVDKETQKIKIYLKQTDNIFYLPGILTKAQESVGAAINRLINKKIDTNRTLSIKKYITKYLTVMTDSDRDNRGHVISLPIVLLASEINDLTDFYDINDLDNKEFLYDHSDIIMSIKRMLKSSLTHKPMYLHLMPSLFTIRELQNVCGQIDNQFNDMTLSNFKKLTNSRQFIEETNTFKKGQKGRSSRYFTLNKESEHIHDYLS